MVLLVPRNQVNGRETFELQEIKVAMCNRVRDKLGNMLRPLSQSVTCIEVSIAVQKLTRDSSGQYSDFHILSSLNSQLFKSSALMHVSAVRSLLSALRQLSHQCMAATLGAIGQASNQNIGRISFSVERMLSILVNNLHRVEPLWDEVVGHFLELADSSNDNLRNIGLDALDKSISAVLGSDQFQESTSLKPGDVSTNKQTDQSDLRSLECAVISPLKVLCSSSESIDVRVGSLKILLHVLERHGEKLCYSWPNILDMLRSVAHSSEKDLITLGFQVRKTSLESKDFMDVDRRWLGVSGSLKVKLPKDMRRSLRVIMNDGLSTIPADCLHVCIDVAGAYSAQKTELNISLTAVGLLWTSTDFIVKGLLHGTEEDTETDQRNSEKGEEHTLDLDNEVIARTSLLNFVDGDKLLLSIFALLQQLVADERPEVRNSAVRTLFQTLGIHGQKLSKSMWEDCLWNYVFPTLDRVSHMAATSSKDEWQGKELGTRKGKAVHMLIHHSRNTAQKQWNETLVLVLGGIARILRSFFPFLRRLNNFHSGWESLLIFVKNSISNGSKEVALAAINCLQSTVVSQSPKGSLPSVYLKSVLDVYEIVLQKSPNCSADATSKVKQEILHGLGELYVQAQAMFDDGMYKQLILIIESAITEAKFTINNFEAEYGHVPPVQRTILEIIPMLRPAGHLSSMWSFLLGILLHYLPSPDSLIDNNEDDPKQVSTSSLLGNSASVVPSTLENKGEDSTQSSELVSAKMADNTNNMFSDKLLPLLVDLFLQAPSVEKYNILPDIIQGLGRCMTTRRDNPDGTLWRVAVEGFNRILVDDVSYLNPAASIAVLSISRPSRIRFWKELADVYELFLVGHCGRALPSNALSVTAVQADEFLEMKILEILGDKILTSQIDAPVDILRRLISTLDRCASRTSSLPIETVELMPSHCSRFSLTCLQKLFSLSSYGTSDWNLTRSEVSKISIMIVMSRCEFILKKFMADEKDLGEHPLPPTRVEEVIFVLEELARLVIHLDTASVLPLHPYLKGGLLEENLGRHSHLLFLFPSFCELVTSREAKVRELVQVLLRLITAELGLQRQDLAS
ncbi:ARM repeat superfamily protein [Forsythia ovata]|uniref:ARM repeat superfamily protein n=1 Tax=Forsythia ovata TaxID=205694 RepID=A0ABD1NWX7_9LAMI